MLAAVFIDTYDIVFEIAIIHITHITLYFVTWDKKPGARDC